MARTDRQLDPENPAESDERQRARERHEETAPPVQEPDDADGDAPV